MLANGMWDFTGRLRGLSYNISSYFVLPVHWCFDFQSNIYLFERNLFIIRMRVFGISLNSH
jgi:hypothetical protein